MKPAEKLPPPTAEQMQAMDETHGYVGVEVELPARRGDDLCALVMLPAEVVDGVNKGTMSLDIEGWDD